MTVPSPPHIAWLKDTGERITTACGRVVPVWEIQHQNDNAILSAWAIHFRNNYCDDQQIMELIEGTGMTKSQYLLSMKFPDAKEPPGPAVRSGDFAEIIITDYLQFVMGYWCPRERYNEKTVRNESTKGSDVLGFKFASETKYDPKDELFIFESKAALTGKPQNRLQDAINDSIKDAKREGMSLNALKQRFISRGNREAALRIQRFQNITDKPYRRINGAAAIHSITTFDKALIEQATATAHHNQTDLSLLVVRGETLMDLVHALYERAANEA